MTVDAAAGDDARVTTLELFFDLVFVFTITQLTALLERGLSIEVVGQVVLVFLVLFWMYGGYAWLTNAVPPDRPVRRLLLILGMGAFFICALALPRVFAGDGVAFGVGYLIVVVVHAGLYARTYGSAVFYRLAPLNGLAAVAVLVAGALPVPAAYALWIAAIAIQFVSPTIAGSGDVFALRPAHFVERHGLLLLIALGESVIAVGVGVGVGTGARSLEAATIASALLGLTVAAGLWWTYFGIDEELADRAMAKADGGARFGLAIKGYFFAFIPMLLGIVATAAGIHDTVGHLADPVAAGDALVLGAGLAMYLAGEAAFRHVMGAPWSATRLLGAVAALATAIPGAGVAGGVQLAAVALIPAIIVAIDSRRRSLESVGEPRT